MTHDRDAGVDEPGDRRGEGGAAFDLHRFDAAFLQEASAVAEKFGEAVVRQAEGQVTDHKRFGLRADHRGGVMDHHVQGHADRIR